MIRSAITVLSLAAGSLAFAQAPGKPSPSAFDMHQLMLNGAHEAMGMKPSADLDRDFAMMLRHQHKISVRLAEHEMQHGKDPALRELARKVAETQKKEMQELDAWLKGRAAAK